MSGVTVVDRRDLERLLKALLHTTKRDDVRLDIKYYVQFSLDGDYSAQTLVDPWQPFSRANARELVAKAIETLDAEEAKNDQALKAKAVISITGDEDQRPAESRIESLKQKLPAQTQEAEGDLIL